MNKVHKTSVLVVDCTKAESMLLSYHAQMVFHRAMQMSAWGAGLRPVVHGASDPTTSLTTGICPFFVPVSPTSFSLSSAQPGARQSSHPLRSNSPSPQPPSNASGASSLPQQCSPSESATSLENTFLAASSPKGWSLLGGDMLMVSSVRPAKQMSRSSSIFNPAQLHFPTVTPLSLRSLSAVGNLSGLHLPQLIPS